MRFLFLSPPEGDQGRIVDIIERLQADVERLEANYQEKLARLVELEQAILEKAFAGELTAGSVEAVQEAAE